MKIVLYGINYAPEVTGIGKYSGEMCEWLASRGHEVSVVTAPPYYPEWRVGSGYRAGAYRREHLRGVRIWRCPLWVPHRQTGLRRVLHLASFALSSFIPLLIECIRRKPDWIFVVEPAFFCVPGALTVATITGARAWLHVQDFELDAAFALGIFSSKVVERTIAVCESLLMRMFKVVSSISENMTKRLVEKGVADSRVVLFQNWVDVELIFPDNDAGLTFRDSLEIGRDKIVALYSGNMGEKQGLETLIAVAKQVSARDEILFVLCGDGASRQRLEELAEGLQNVRFLPLQPLEELRGLLCMADIHLLPQRAGAADLVMPSKLTGILASGRPVIAGADTGTALRMVVEKAGGVACDPENESQMAAALLSLAADRISRDERGRRAREYAVRNLGLDSILGKIESIMAR